MGPVNSDHGSVYPNPFTTSATICLDPPVSHSDLDIYNIHGRKVRHISTVSGRRINTERGELARGAYR